MTRPPCELRLRRGTWSPEEDHKLIAYVQRYGHWNWNYVSIFAGLSRSGKSCRLRWKNYLRPNIKHGNFSIAEVEVIIKMQHELGNRWSMIASKLPGRTDNEIKNYWNTRLRKHMKHESSSSSSELGKNTFKNSPKSSDEHFILASNRSTSGSPNSVGFGSEEMIRMSSPELSNLSYNSFSSFDRAESDASSTITEVVGTENTITGDPFEDWFVELGKLLEEPFQWDPLFDDNGIW